MSLKFLSRAVLIINTSFCFSLFANNGANLIGASAASISLGGTGVANVTNGTDALYKNPALLTQLPQAIESVGVEVNTTILKLNATGSYSDTSVSSATDVPNQTTTRIIPNVVGTYRANDKLAFGLGILGQAGSTSNYPNERTIAHPMSDVTFARISPTVAYQFNEWLSAGITPFIGYGEFALNESASTGSGFTIQSARKPHSAVALGAQVGFHLKAAENVSVGISGSSKTSYKFKELTDVESFTFPFTPNALDDIEVEQPWEFAAGVAYRANSEWAFTGDYRMILWGSSAGYSSFGWKTQHVFALGTQYKPSDWAFRLGFNYAASPYESNQSETAGNADLQGHNLPNKSVSDLNLFAFPAIATSHLTLGTGYQFGKQFELDAGFMYAFSTTVTRGGTGNLGETYAYSTKASLWSFTLGGRYQF